MRKFSFGSACVLPCMLLLSGACSSEGPKTSVIEVDAGVDAYVPPPPPVPTNTDGMRNGTETDVDCGGMSAPKCVEGRRCLQATDCKTNSCVGRICASASTADGVKNGSETDIDCGGTMAQKCDSNKACLAATDCVSAVCTGNVCKAATANDGVKNASETDVDCGGGTAPKCEAPKACVAAGDCASGACKTNICQVATSSDAIKNGDESDVDCGGTTTSAVKCALARTCVADADCGSAICNEAKHCIEAQSCRILHGGETCGTGEYGQAGAVHESCCKSLPVAGLTVMQGGVPKQVYLDKYEVTAGRVRTWLEAIKTQYGGVPNIRAWVQARVATDPLLAAMYPAAPAPYVGNMTDYLPSMYNGETKPFTVYPPLLPLYGNQSVVQIEMGLDGQIGPTSYFRGLVTGGTSGCAMYAGASGHRTVWTDDTKAAEFGELSRGGTAARDSLDEKSANCMTPLMFAAFCAWDGGYVQSQAAYLTAYGTGVLPWGAPAAGRTINQDGNDRTNYNINGLANLFANPPKYNYPLATNYADGQTQLIAAPGRFPLDIASTARPGMESWMDISGNMLEWYHETTGGYRGWGGSSFEGHQPDYYGKVVRGIFFLEKYGKGSTRCMRLR
jgi:hypothetical protein